MILYFINVSSEICRATPDILMSKTNSNNRLLFHFQNCNRNTDLKIIHFSGDTFQASPFRSFPLIAHILSDEIEYFPFPLIYYSLSRAS